MRQLQFVIVALMCFSSAAIAQNAPAWPGGAQRSAIAFAGTRASHRVVRDANDCAPDRATAVWGANSALLGYSCATPSANR
jgi:hypothetical protein